MEEKEIEKIMLDTYKICAFGLFLAIASLVSFGSLLNKETNFNGFMLSGGIWILALFWFVSFISGNPYGQEYLVYVRMPRRAAGPYDHNNLKKLKKQLTDVYFKEKIWKKTAVWTTILTLLLLIVCYAIFLLKPHLQF